MSFMDMIAMQVEDDAKAQKAELEALRAERALTKFATAKLPKLAEEEARAEGRREVLEIVQELVEAFEADALRQYYCYASFQTEPAKRARRELLKELTERLS
jgi:hypothetical protein